VTPCVEKKITSGRMLGVCYILSMTIPPILGGQTRLWFFSWVSHMVLGMMVFFPLYFVDPLKGTTVIL